MDDKTQQKIILNKKCIQDHYNRIEKIVIESNECTYTKIGMIETHMQCIEKYDKSNKDIIRNFFK